MAAIVNCDELYEDIPEEESETEATKNEKLMRETENKRVVEANHKRSEDQKTQSKAKFVKGKQLLRQRILAKGQLKKMYKKGDNLRKERAQKMLEAKELSKKYSAAIAAQNTAENDVREFEQELDIKESEVCKMDVEYQKFCESTSIESVFVVKAVPLKMVANTPTHEMSGDGRKVSPQMQSGGRGSFRASPIIWNSNRGNFRGRRGCTF